MRSHFRDLIAAVQFYNPSCGEGIALTCSCRADNHFPYVGRTAGQGGGDLPDDVRDFVEDYGEVFNVSVTHRDGQLDRVLLLLIRGGQPVRQICRQIPGKGVIRCFGFALGSGWNQRIIVQPWTILSTAFESLASGGCGRFGFGISRVGKSHLIFGRLKICSPGTLTEPIGGLTHGG